MVELIDLTGRRFGRYAVLSLSHKHGRSYMWSCRCDCGTEKAVKGSHLKDGSIKSCGCLKAETARIMMTKHGGAAQDKSARHPLYSIWCGIHKRCVNPNSHAFEYYGGRGIKMCERWRHFELFCQDMGERPTAAHTIDRIDCNGHYSPENCRWATMAEQLKNRRPYTRRKNRPANWAELQMVV